MTVAMVGESNQGNQLPHQAPQGVCHHQHHTPMKVKVGMGGRYEGGREEGGREGGREGGSEGVRKTQEVDRHMIRHKSKKLVQLFKLQIFYNQIVHVCII